MAAQSLPALPTPEELELATYKAGSFISDLEHFHSRLEGQRPDAPESLVEYEARRICGETFAVPEIDRDYLAEVVVFATEAIQEADTVREYATKLQAEALALYREQPFDGALHWQRVRDWHLAEVEAK